MIPLVTIFERLQARHGPRHWWPAENPFEVCAGAILTQNTNWGNVEKALANLKAAGRLSPEGISSLPPDQLAALIRSAGYFNAKARSLQEFAGFLLQTAQGDLARLFAGDWQLLRQQLLSVRGIGPETADSMLLYAGQQPSFVVDAYTRRIFSRLGLVDPTISYELLRTFCMERLPPEVPLYNEFHALLVEHGKQHCRPCPRCGDCCLADCCAFSLSAPLSA
ncbi:MAG: endonuclease III domain-containing protein [Trichlorobacter sp.]|jgi:endonuclease-3 related protein